MAKTAREAALTILERCRRDGAFSDSLLTGALADCDLEIRDRALAYKLTMGVLKNSLLLDFYIDSFCGSKLEPKVRDILRLSLYQILFLERIPDHAAVNIGVELCKTTGYARAAKLVNAVLRRATANQNTLPEIPRNSVSAYFSIKYSTPAALVSRFIHCFGEEFTEKLLASNNETAPLTILTNTLKTTTEELVSMLEKQNISCEPHAFLRDCLVLGSTGDLTCNTAFKDGLYYVQDPAARLSIAAAAPRPGDKVLDACSAPGGKSFACALTMENIGEIVSCDIHKNKLSRVRKSAERLGLSIISTEEMNAKEPRSDFFNLFDLVIADVPCSGLGVIRKKPEIRLKNLAELDKLPELQLGILDSIAACVKPGGTLLYSTCTVLKSENEEVAARFLAAHEEFSAEAFVLPDPIGEVKGGMITLFPHIHGTDGFFICKLRKRHES